MLRLLPRFSRLPQPVAAEILSSVLRTFTNGRDRSVFGLMNAVTSVARDEPEPETRWRLEELGGAILESLPSGPKPRGVAAALACAR
jgi:hypothetical protein